ncbi:hypothetical protein ACFSJQ_04795 [Vibrio olivae]|uniref:Uncharacterized protein n=1 Tax=Vibrio olivae TaxID=1243002 RepID=A0ABV5HJQ7_9VIBR
MAKKDKQITEAQDRIVQKLEILKTWAEEGIPEKRSPDGHIQLDSKGIIILEFFPQSDRALRYWTGKDCTEKVREKYQLDKLKTTSNDAWKRAPIATRERWKGTGGNDGLMHQLKARAILQTENSNTSRLQQLEDELASVKLNHRGALNELIQLRVDNKELIEDLKSEKTQHESTRTQSKIENDWRIHQNKLLRNQLNILQSQYNELAERYLELAKRTGETPQLTNANIIDFPEKDKDD